MKVIHLFDKYLNTTMNWAYQLIKHTPDVQPYIAAPTIVKNKFYDTSFQYLRHFLLKKTLQNEWQEGKIWQYWSKIAFHTYYPFWITKQIKKQQITIAHAHFGQVGVRYMHAIQRAKIPLIVSFYGNDYGRIPHDRPKYLTYYRQMFEIATFLVAEGENGAKLLEGLGCPKHKIKIIHLGIEPNKIKFFHRAKRPNALKLVQAATFTEKKGMLYTIRAFAKALEKCPNMTLTLVGEKWVKSYWQQCEDEIVALGISSKVSVLDFISTDFHQFLAAFDVFIHPSCYAANMECEGGAPIVLLDAQAVGLPIISTLHCDIPSEVIHQKTGLLSAEKATDDLAKSISYFYEMNNDHYQSYAHAARQHVMEHYDIHNNASALKQLYEAALKDFGK